MPPRRPRLLYVLPLSTALLVHSPAQGTQTEVRNGLGANIGFGPDAERLGVHWDAALLDRPRQHGRRWTISVETGLSRWRTSDNGRQHAWQLSGVPFVRLWGRNGAFAELGIGASVFSERSLGHQQLGSSFQFCNHLGAGFQWNEMHRIGVRLSHFSNGRIADPNDGLDIWQLTYTRIL